MYNYYHIIISQTLNNAPCFSLRLSFAFILEGANDGLANLLTLSGTSAR
jgi:hypothetical protein